ncbi:MAG: transmembrane amino acid transporter protein-domain-containing protein [Monoraphidium minutum]|nr:MAG: transmembrane amino acid transporter protein-domain-containing protein [Monoraphidium minutum]
MAPHAEASLGVEGSAQKDTHEWALEGADDDVWVPASRQPSALPKSAISHAAPGGRQVSSMLGSLHPHAGHSSWVTAAGHLVTAVIGAGILGLPYAVSWLGWAAGLACLVIFFVITLWSCTMLTDCYHYKGKRHTRYKWAVLHIIGPRHAVVLEVCQKLNMCLTTIGYMIAAADSMRYIARLACKRAGVEACPLDAQWQHTLIFGAVQILMSMMPNLESAWWSSIIGALMSIGYSVLAVALGASQAGNHQGSLTGRTAPPLDKVFGVFNSLGNIAFAFNSAIILMEIQDTLREPPRAEVSMKKTVRVGLGSTFAFYVAVSVCGYMALGDTVPDNVLLGFSNSPDWVSLLANFMVLIHMVSAFQVYAQPVFQTIEDVVLYFRPALQFSNGKTEFFIRLGYRTLYCAFATFIASLLPFFSCFTGLVGAITYWPTAVAYPIMMYIRVKSPSAHVQRLMWTVLVGMGAVALIATVGSVESIAHQASTFTVFEKP